jgi:hypothetical protein
MLCIICGFIIDMPSTPNPWDYAERSGLEHAHQAALFMWVNMAVHFGRLAADTKSSYSEPGRAQQILAGANDKVEILRWFHAIHNQGHGDKIRGAHAKAEGVKAGVFDMFLPVPTNDERGHFFAGLYIELKVGYNQPSADQLAFQAFARSMGYKAEIAWGWIDARRILLEYLRLPVDFIG